MNRFKFCMLILFAAIFSFTTSFAQGKRALIIAVGDYNFSKTRWKPISSAQDVPLIKSALISQGFKEPDIKLLKDNDADKVGIVEALKSLASQTKSGDVVYVHFSGHGQQIQDDNGDEIDGYDEALIPINAHASFRKGFYEGEHHLRDEEFGALLDSIRRKAGAKGNLLVVIDACHSATSTRGDNQITRGTSEVFEAPGYKPADNKSTAGNFGLYNDSPELAQMVCFYGSAAHQPNYEYKLNDSTYVGSLSYAFSKAFTEATPSTTYRGLFDRIRVEMSSIAPNQSPQVEGTLDQEILGGKISGPVDYASVKVFYDENNLTINKGLLHGINKGSKVGFFKNEERDYKNAKPMAIGTVIAAEITEADIQLDSPLSKEDAIASWVFVTEQNFGDMAVKVKIDLKNEELINAIKNKATEFPLIIINDKNYEVIVEENNKYTRGNNIHINTVKDVELWSSNADINDVENVSTTIIQRLIAYSQSRFLRALEVEEEQYKTVLEFIPISVQMQGRNPVESGLIDVSEKIDESGTFVFNEGDYFKIKISNEGMQAVYFCVLDIQPDDKISVLLPHAKRLPQEYRIEPGKSYVSPPIKINPPYGVEIFKLISSDTPIDLRGVVESKGSNPTHRGSASNPFQKLIAETYKPDASTRGAESSGLPSGSAHVKSVVFHISPKK